MGDARNAPLSDPWSEEREKEVPDPDQISVSIGQDREKG